MTDMYFFKTQFDIKLMHKNMDRIEGEKAVTQHATYY